MPEDCIPPFLKEFSTHMHAMQLNLTSLLGKITEFLFGAIIYSVSTLLIYDLSIRESHTVEVQTTVGV